MELELVKIEPLSGKNISVYSFFDEEKQSTLFELFVLENLSKHESEVKNILKSLEAMKQENVGDREHFFKLDEGNLGDGNCALYDQPNSNLRLYCIRYGNSLVIYGGGGLKPKTIRALQENPKLKQENYLLRKLAREIEERRRNKEIQINFEKHSIEGNLNFEF